MKKIICILLSVLVLSTSSFAQDKSGRKADKQEKTTKKKEAAKPVATESDNVSINKDANEPKTKKDGTPDKRYKENKEAKKEVKTKKDGTPDKRYKENKTK